MDVDGGSTHFLVKYFDDLYFVTTYYFVNEW